MEYVLSYVMMFIECFSLCLLGDTLLSKQLCPRWVRGTALLAAPAVGMFLLMFVFTKLGAAAKTLFGLALLFFVLCIRYHIVLKEFLLLVVVFYVVLNAVDSSIMLSFMALSQYSYPEYINDKAAYVCGAFSAKTVELTVCLLFSRIRNAKKNNGGHLTPSTWFYLLLVPVFSIVIDISIISHAVQTNDVGAWAILITIGLLLCNVAVVFLWNQLEREQQTLLENSLLRQSAANDREKVAYLSNAYRQQRRQTHDFQSHMQAVEALLLAGDTGRALAYVRGQAQNAHPLSARVMHTNNPLVDMLLDQKYQAAKEQDVSLRLIADDLESLPIQDADFVALLSNLADNAIEAAARNPGEKAVHIKLRQNPNGAFILSVRNTSRPVEIVDQTIQTTKQDGMAHGFGLANAKRIVAQNGGECYLLQKDGWVQFTASLPQKQHFTPQNAHFTPNDL